MGSAAGFHFRVWYALAHRASGERQRAEGRAAVCRPAWFGLVWFGLVRKKRSGFRSGALPPSDKLNSFVPNVTLVALFGEGYVVKLTHNVIVSVATSKSPSYAH